MTAENVYLYMFLVGAFFAVGNIAIGGISRMIGGFGGGNVETESWDAIEMDGAGATEAGGDISGAEFGDAGGDLGVEFGDAGGDLGGVEFGDAGGEIAGDVEFGDVGGGGGNVEFGDAGGSFGDGAGADPVSGIDAESGIEYADAQAPDITKLIGEGGAGHGMADTQPDSGAGDMPKGGTAGAEIREVRAGGVIRDRSAETGTSQSGPARYGFMSAIMTWLPLRPTALICFSAVTGGAGTIFSRLDLLNPLTHAISIASGYGLSMLIGVALPQKLRRAQNTSAAERYELIGLPAIVTSTILEGGFGRISYTVRDNAQSAPARHIDGGRVPQGSRVVICEIKKHVFYVTELNI